MTLQDVVDHLELSVLTSHTDLEQVAPTSGYASDLLSCVMAGAGRGAIWVTLQAHSNVVAVAALLELSAIIITEGASPDADTVAKAEEEKVTLLLTSKPTFHVVGRLWEMGLRES